MPAYFLPIIVGTINLMVLSVLGFYIWTTRKEKKKFEAREKELATKESKLESGFQQIIDNALAKERKMLEDAAKQATEMLSDTQYISNTSKDSLDKALQKMAVDIQNQAAVSSKGFQDNYMNLLGQISEKSLANLQNNIKQFETDMQKQMHNFRELQLAGIQKELESYKQERLKEADTKVNEIIKQVSEKVFNESIPLENHQKLIIEALEKSKKEGIFD